MQCHSEWHIPTNSTSRKNANHAEVPGLSGTQCSVAVLTVEVTHVIPAHPYTHLQSVFSKVLLVQLQTLTCS